VACEQAGYTALDFALYHQHTAVAMMLLESGAPVNVKGPVRFDNIPTHMSSPHSCPPSRMLERAPLCIGLVNMVKFP
jgi:hypothetical protein